MGLWQRSCAIRRYQFARKMGRKLVFFIPVGVRRRGGIPRRIVRCIVFMQLVWQLEWQFAIGVRRANVAMEYGRVVEFFLGPVHLSASLREGPDVLDRAPDQEG
jgi:hypothetical protein